MYVQCLQCHEYEKYNICMGNTIYVWEIQYRITGIFRGKKNVRICLRSNFRVSKYCTFDPIENVNFCVNIMQHAEREREREIFEVCANKAKIKLP